MLTVSKIFKTYGKAEKSFQALKGVSFEVASGECLGLLGPNGAGKSTTMNCLTGFYPVDSGEVFIEGFDVFKDPKKARRSLGVCSQEDSLDTDFTVLNQLLRFGTFFGLTKREALKNSQRLLNEFLLADKAHLLVEELSGGMRRRLQVARSLVANPKLLVLDEPTTGLDPEVRRDLWQVVQRQKSNGVAILLSTHYMDEAHRLCDRIAVMSEGKILDTETPENLIKKYVSQDSVREEIRPGVTWERPPNLEDVYLELTGRHLEG